MNVNVICYQVDGSAKLAPVANMVAHVIKWAFPLWGALNPHCANMAIGA